MKAPIGKIISTWGENMQNIELRLAISEARLRHYEIAQVLGVSDSAFSKMLREELTGEKRDQVLKAIQQLTGGVSGAGC